MKLIGYIKSKLSSIFIYLFTLFIIFLLLCAFKVNISLIIAIFCLLGVLPIIILLINYYKKKSFYQELLSNIEQLDQKYLVLEMIQKPNFYEGNLIYQALYEINKSMHENVNSYETSIEDFKDYIEMWIHEVKVPISSLTLMAHNHKDQMDTKVLNQIKRIDNYIEQVLYYVRSENAEKDYLITENKLDKMISTVALKNKDDLLENKIDFQVENVSYSVLTDSKWLEFILNQIISNSIKYHSTNSIIKISATKIGDDTILSIYDNGIGIPQTDISKVFEKSFTGHNGRIRSKSTGMGLYIAKKLCDKLGHKILISSEEGKYTKVDIIFHSNNYYDVLK